MNDIANSLMKWVTGQMPGEWGAEREHYIRIRRFDKASVPMPMFVTHRRIAHDDAGQSRIGP